MQTNRQKHFYLRKALIIFLDMLLIALGLLISILLRFGENPSPGMTRHMMTVVRFSPVILGVSLFFLFVMGVYRVYWRFADMRDMLRIVLALSFATLTNLLINRVFKLKCTRIVLSLDGILSILFLISARFAWILIQDRLMVDKNKKNVRRALIIGASPAGAALAKRINESPTGSVRHEAVGFLDEDVERLYRKVSNLTVEGTLADAPAVIARKRVDEVIFSDRSLPTQARRRVFRAARRAGCSVLMADGGTLRPVRLEDVLAGWRREEDGALSGAYAGRRALIVGAGRIGARAAALLAEAGAQVTVVDQDEDRLAASALKECECVLADLADEAHMERIVRAANPELVCLAAGLSRENASGSALRIAAVNVAGAAGLWKAARDAGAEKFVMVAERPEHCPDNLAQAARVVGAEEIHALSAQEDGMRTYFVLYRNLVSSSGSVLGHMLEKAARGETLTVRAGETYSFVSEADVAHSALRVATACEPGTYVIDSEDPVSAEELAKLVCREADAHAEVSVEGEAAAAETEAATAEDTPVEHVRRLSEDGAYAARLQRASAVVREALKEENEEKAARALRSVCAAGEPE